MLNWWTGMVFKGFGIKVIVNGAAIPGPVLIVSNHISWLDILALHSTAKMGFVSKAEVARWPFIGFLARLSGTVFHERGSQNSSSNVTTVMVNRLNEGGRIGIFPEGGIWPGDTIKVFHSRLLKAAVEAPCPIQPAMIRYVRDGQRDSDITFRDGENFMVNFIRLLGHPSCVCEVVYLEPIHIADSPRKDLAAQARLAILDAFEGQVRQ
ncbi:MAG: 1-acyl-sn-glycerol-3-phosphate acyltransferase [Lysobacterales bacterium]|jgi:1-acyl-sn-glycerol-3-phosphate acyltransferase